MSIVFKNTPFRQFVFLHADLLKKLYLTDLLFVPCALAYLFLPMPEIIEPFRVGVLVLLTVLFFVTLNMRLVAQHTGGTGFYRLLPLHGMATALRVHGIVLLPFVLLIVFTVIVRSLFTEVDMAETGKKAGLIVAVFCTIKCMCLPTFLLLRRSILLSGAFCLTLLPLLFAVSLFDELLWSAVPLTFFWDVATYLVLLFGLEMWVVTRCNA